MRRWFNVEKIIQLLVGGVWTFTSWLLISICYTRTYEGKQLLVVANMSEKPGAVSLNDAAIKVITLFSH